MAGEAVAVRVLVGGVVSDGEDGWYPVGAVIHVTPAAALTLTANSYVEGAPPPSASKAAAPLEDVAAPRRRAKG
jgi:hypothetical protein